jgi:hypothetical protein
MKKVRTTPASTGRRRQPAEEGQGSLRSVNQSGMAKILHDERRKNERRKKEGTEGSQRRRMTPGGMWRVT